MDKASKESAYWLQRIDCNCNDCGFMIRDLVKFKKWELWHREQDLIAFEKKKAKAIADAEALEDEQGRKTMLARALKMRFFFDKSGLISYGRCEKFNKLVSFLPNTCQLDTQHCFVHRKDYVHDSATTQR